MFHSCIKSTMKATAIFLLLSVLSLNKYSFSKQNSKLLLVQIVLRHGDRAPDRLYKNDPNPVSSWPQGLGELTLLGKKQHYNLGKYLHRRYENFTSFTPQEIKVISAHMSRCMMSAQANLATFFAPSEAWTFEKDFHWQPIPINYVPEKNDKYLEVVRSSCPRAEAEDKKLMNSPEAKKFNDENKEMYAALSRISGENISDFRQASKFRYHIEIEKIYGLKTPPAIEPYWKKLGNLSEWSYFYSFNSPVTHKLRGGPLIKKMIINMEHSVSGKYAKRKFVVYSCHSTTIVALLTALDLYDFRRPPYCATLLFELHLMPNKELTVRILFMNSTEPEKKIEEPHTMVLKGCEEFCPLRFFLHFTKDLIPRDWEKECQLDQRSSPTP